MTASTLTRSTRPDDLAVSVPPTALAPAPVVHAPSSTAPSSTAPTSTAPTSTAPTSTAPTARVPDVRPAGDGGALRAAAADLNPRLARVSFRAGIASRRVALAAEAGDDTTAARDQLRDAARELRAVLASMLRELG